MEQAITISQLVYVGGVLVALWAAMKAVREIIAYINSRHDREQKLDEMDKKMEELSVKMVENIQNEREQIYSRYDDKLAEMEKQIEDNHTDTEAKFQQVQAELFILVKCMDAVLDGLHQQGCNGKVTEARETLDQYMIKRTHYQE